MRDFIAKIDRRYAKVCIYASVTVLITLALGMMLWYSTGFFVTLWELLCAVFVPILVGAALSYLINPLVAYVSHWLARRGYRPDDGKRRRRLAVAITIALLVLFVAALIALFAALVTHSISGIDIKVVRDLIDSAQGDLVKIASRVEQELQRFGIAKNGLGLEQVTGAVGSVKDFLENALFSLIFCIYFLLDGPAVFSYLERVVNALFGSNAMSRMELFFADADRVFSGYIRGQSVDALVVGVLSSVCFTLIGIPYGIAVGMLTGLGNLIPYVGGPVGYLSLVLVCLADGTTGKLIAGIVALTLIMLVDANVINPRLLSQNVEVHPLLVVAALIAGSAIGGIVGMLAAVPVVAFIKVKVDSWIECREMDGAVQDAGAEE